MLLSGREGLGKSLFAHGIAASFFCRTGNACGECDQCTAVMAESHPEVFSLDTEGAVIKVEDAILVQQHLELHSQASYRIVIISDIDLLTQQASNRLLKTLEEPPLHARFLLTTSRRDSLLPTVLSRSVEWDIRPPEIEKTVRWLSQKSDAAVGQDEIKDLVMLNGRSPGLSLKYLSDTGPGEKEIDELVYKLLFSSDYFTVLSTAEVLAKEKKLTAWELAGRIEITLNKVYKIWSGLDCDKKGPKVESPLRLMRWRELLHNVRSASNAGRTALNTQLFAEAMGLAR